MSIYISWHPHQQLLSDSILTWVWTGFSFSEKQWESTNEAENLFIMLIVVQLPNYVWIFVTTYSATCKSYLFFTIPQSLLKLISIELVMPPNHLILCHPFSFFLQSLSASGSFPISQVFTSGGQSIRVSTSASVLPMNIQDWFFSRIDWLDLLVVQGTLKSLLQHHCSKPSILWLSAFFMATLTSIHDYWEKQNKTKHRFNYTDLCQQGDVSTFYYAV